MVSSAVKGQTIFCPQTRHKESSRRIESWWKPKVAATIIGLRGWICFKGNKTFKICLCHDAVPPSQSPRAFRAPRTHSLLRASGQAPLGEETVAICRRQPMPGGIWGGRWQDRTKKNFFFCSNKKTCTILLGAFLSHVPLSSLPFLLSQDPSETPPPTRAETKEERVVRKVFTTYSLTIVILCLIDSLE